MADDSECRYVLHKHGGTISLGDTLHSHTHPMWIGIKNVEAIGLTRSDLVELKNLIAKALKKP